MELSKNGKRLLRGLTRLLPRFEFWLVEMDKRKWVLPYLLAVQLRQEHPRARVIWKGTLDKCLELRYFHDLHPKATKRNRRRYAVKYAN